MGGFGRLRAARSGGEFKAALYELYSKAETTEEVHAVTEVALEVRPAILELDEKFREEFYGRRMFTRGRYSEMSEPWRKRVEQEKADALREQAWAASRAPHPGLLSRDEVVRK